MRKLDEFNGPAHYYNFGKANVGPLDYAEQQELSISQHAVIKYVTRAGRKKGNTALKDYKQAKFYLERLIAEEESLKDINASLQESATGVGGSSVSQVIPFDPFGMLHEAPRYCTQCQHPVGNSATGRDSGSTICEGAPGCNCPNAIHAAKVR